MKYFLLCHIGSGFVDSVNNNNGPVFGLYAIDPDGEVSTIPKILTANIQLIHNSADIAQSLVDVYIDDAKWRDAFPFKEGTEFFEVNQRCCIAGHPENVLKG